MCSVVIKANGHANVASPVKRRHLFRSEPKNSYNLASHVKQPVTDVCTKLGCHDLVVFSVRIRYASKVENAA